MGEMAIKVSLMTPHLPRGACLRAGSSSADTDIGREGEGWREDMREEERKRGSENFSHQ